MHWAVNDTPAEVTNLPTQLLWGEEWIEEELGGLRFRVRPNAFLQTNTAMAEKLYALARDAAQLTGGETVWDLYCGIGTIGLSMASQALTVWGIEVSEESVACALENAELNGISNAAFFAGNVGQVDAGAARPLRRRRTSSSSTRRARGSPARRCAGSARSARRASSTSRATRRRSPRDVKLLRDEYGYELAARAPGRHVPAHAARRDASRCSSVPSDRWIRAVDGSPHVNRDTEGAMRNDGAPVAARTKVDPAAIDDSANLHVQVTGATKRFHLWQQGPAWTLGFAAIGLGFLMVLRGYDSAGGLVRGLDGDRALGDRVVPLAVLDRRDVGQLGAGSSPEEEGDADRRIRRPAPSARAGRRSRRGSRRRGTAAPAGRRRRARSRRRP